MRFAAMRTAAALRRTTSRVWAGFSGEDGAEDAALVGASPPRRESRGAGMRPSSAGAMRV